MGPNIQLIQLTLRVERNAEAQRRPQMAYSDDLAAEKPVYRSTPKRNSRVKRSFNLTHRQQNCECV